MLSRDLTVDIDIALLASRAANMDTFVCDPDATGVARLLDATKQHRAEVMRNWLRSSWSLFRPLVHRHTSQSATLNPWEHRQSIGTSGSHRTHL